MKRMIMVILIVAVFAGAVQAHTPVIIPGSYYPIYRPVVVHTPVIIPGSHYPIYHHPVVVHTPVIIPGSRYPWYSYGGYGHYGRYSCGTQRVAVVGSIGLGVLDTVIRAQQEDKAIKIAERQMDLQQQQVAVANAAREDAERQQLFAQATELKARQTEKENQVLRAENERLRLELEQKELREKLNK